METRKNDSFTNGDIKNDLPELFSSVSNDSFENSDDLIKLKKTFF